MSLSSSDSQSQANTSSTTNTTDMRVVGGADSIPISAQNSTVSVVTTDAGTVHDAFGFATTALQGALNQVSSSDSSAQANVQKALDQVAAAWAGAKAGEQKILVGMGIIVVALVGVAAIKKG